MEYMQKYLFIPSELEKASAAWPVRMGISEAPSGFYSGERVLPYYRLSFVLAGAALFRQKDKSYCAQQYDLFCTFPHIPFEYSLESQRRLRYIWLAFEGPQSGQLLARIGIKHCTPLAPQALTPEMEQLLFQLAAMAEAAADRDQDLLRLIGFYQLFHTLSRQREVTARDRICSDEWLERAKEHIELHYAEEITMESVAEYAGVERSYFSRKFKQTFGVTPLKYLQELRIAAAKRLLLTTDLNLSAIAHSIGYVDMFSFSKAFKKAVGFSPNEYRFRSGTR